MASFGGLNFDQSVQSSQVAQQHARASTTRYRDRIIAKFTMVVPSHVGFAVDRGDIAVVESWLNMLVRGRAKTNGLNERIALPNGACWKVLSYWREDN